VTSFFEEIKRRNVVRVGVAYGIAAWVLLQVADLVLEAIEAPAWVLQALMLVVALGFIAAVVIAWAYEMTPEGIRKEAEVDRTQSIAGQTGKKLDRIIIAFLVVAVGVLLVAEKGSEPFSQAETAQVTDQETGKRALTPFPVNNAIAALPFANRSNVEEDLFFTDGIHDDLLTQLTKIDGLKVISRTSVMEYRNTTKKIPEIAAELGVGKILEGGVQRAGNRVRINAQLIDVATDEHLWAETFDREMTIDNLFDIQSEITRQIVAAVKGELSAADEEALTSSPTDNVEAYEAYLRARALTLRGDYVSEHYVEAQPWVQRAVDLDPDFAEAWALLVEIHGQAVWQGWDRSDQRRAEAEAALANALRLKPESPAVIAAEADFYYRFDEDYKKALGYFERAHEAAPGDSRILVFKAITERRAGYWDESIASFEQALELDPSNSFIINQLIDTLGNMNQWDRVRYLTDTYILRFPSSRDLRSFQLQSRIYADGDLAAARELMNQMPTWSGTFYVFPALELARFERDYDRMLELLETDLVRDWLDQAVAPGLSQSLAATAHHLKGDAETARGLFLKSNELLEAYHIERNTESAFKWSIIATNLAFLGDDEAAIEASEKSLDLLSGEDDHIFGVYNEQTHTWILAMAGKRDEALERLRARIDQPEGYNRWTLHFDPQWDFFRDDPRFVALATPAGVTDK
jgi:TolB-like protein/Tfp pilus assembly protein PilF